MAFYEELSRYYDEIFAVSAAEMSFIREKLAGRKRILDLGCGTGNKTELLAEADRLVVGLDLDPAMIDLARKKHSGPGLEYRVGDLSTFGRDFPPASFEALLCLGNTLPHLTRPGQLRLFMDQAAATLAPGGDLILQILNYDHILDDQVRELPLIETEEAVFRRYYDWSGPGEPTEIRFRTRLEIKGGPAYDHDIPLKPIRRAELENLMAENFEAPVFFGGYDGRPLNRDSLPLLSLAKRVIR
jgi:2-polyprenyl-3-methyl-5-hydroxy-6-metoxy-1,4-benzoquinol methylase